MISCGFTISTVCSLQFATVNGDDVEKGISIHRFLWAI